MDILLALDIISFAGGPVGMIVLFLYLNYTSADKQYAREVKKFKENQQQHWNLVKDWKPRCHCMQYCYMISTFSSKDYMTYIDTGSLKSTISMQRSSLNTQFGKGQIRPMHCIKPATRHPGYIKRRGLISFTRYLKKPALHKGLGASRSSRVQHHS